MKVDWKAILHLAVPIICAVVPAAAPLAPFIIAGISEAEAIKGASSAEKKAHALNIITAGATATNVAAGKVVIDPMLVTATASQAIDTAVGVTNLIHKNQQ